MLLACFFGVVECKVSSVCVWRIEQMRRSIVFGGYALNLRPVIEIRDVSGVRRMQLLDVASALQDFTAATS